MQFNENPSVHADKNKWITWNFNEEWDMYMVLKSLPIKHLWITKYKSVTSHWRNHADISNQVIKVNIQMWQSYRSYCKWITWI